MKSSINKYWIHYNKNMRYQPHSSKTVACTDYVVNLKINSGGKCQFDKSLQCNRALNAMAAT